MRCHAQVWDEIGAFGGFRRHAEYAPTSPYYYFWDPAGFTADGSVENFKRRRQTELKHGRISMLATMGFLGEDGSPTSSWYLGEPHLHPLFS